MFAALIAARLVFAGAVASLPLPAPCGAIASLMAACNTDARLDGRDIKLFVDCFTTAAAGCNCWDLSDSGTLDATDVSLLVSTLLGDLPYAVADHAYVYENVEAAIAVLANDLDPHGPGTTVALGAIPAHGTVLIAGDNSIHYAPASGYLGADSFTYRAVNAFGASPLATVYITVVVCMPLFADCDGNPVNGCETAVNTLSNCGGCGIPCTRANASTSCSAGQCMITSCNFGYSNCDGNDANGCETMHIGYSNSYNSAEFVGSACGDVTTGALCITHPPFSSFATRTGGQGRYLRAHVAECSNCGAQLQARITLSVPPGIDFDLYAYRSGGTLVGSSTNGQGAQEQIILIQDDNFPVDDSFDYWIEVRFFGGSSCTPWTLTFEGRN